MSNNSIPPIGAIQSSGSATSGQSTTGNNGGNTSNSNGGKTFAEILKEKMDNSSN